MLIWKIVTWPSTYTVSYGNQFEIPSELPLIGVSLDSDGNDKRLD